MPINPFFFLVQKLRDSRISVKFILFILIFSAFPMILTNYVYYFKLQQGIKDEVAISYKQLISQYVNSINYKINLYTNTLDNISVNGMILDVLSSKDSADITNMLDTSKKISNEIESLVVIRNSTEIYNISIYPIINKIPTDGRYINSVGNIRDKNWYKDIFNDKNYSFFDLSEGTNEKIISLVSPIVDLRNGNFSRRLGIARIDLKAADLFKFDIKQVDDTELKVFVCDSLNNIVYKSSDVSDEFIRNYKAGSNVGNMDSNRIILTNKIGNTDYTAVFILHSAKIQSKLNEAKTFIIGIVIVSTLLLIGLILIFSNFFTRRINLLIKKMKRVSKGSLEITDRLQGKDEIGIIDENFNHMVGKLKVLIEENYIKTMETKEAELNALQVQINPHFLYNTLESINAISSLKGCYEVCKISQALGDMFRYSINVGSKEYASLYDEIQHLKNYLYIQKIRYVEMFDFRINIPEEINDCRVLKFILQPFVENSLYHGFIQKTDKGHIEISSVLKENMLEISIMDDGDGIPEQKLYELNAFINEDLHVKRSNSRGSIGIRNVNMRIKLAFGDDFGVKISSIVNQGTSVYIKIPFLGYLKEDENV